MCIVAYVGVKINEREQYLKLKYSQGIVDSDIRFTGKAVVQLILLGLIGGFISGALGLGGGTIFNPILLNMGLPPSVASSTSMYLVFFSTASSSVLYFIYGLLDIYYAMWLGLWAIIGTVAGLIILNN